MRYAIITNPASGKMDIDQKRSALSGPSQILGAEIHGLDTTSPEDLAQCARELAGRCDVLVTAGGDGTFSDIINSVNTAQTTIAYLPLGTGNCMRHALNYKGNLADMAVRIKNGKIHQYDLINCNERRRAFTVALGIEGAVIRLRDRYLARGRVGLSAYFRAALNAYFREYKRVSARIAIDDRVFQVKNMLTLMVVKQPYYGYGMNVVPRARFDDQQLHVLYVDSGLFKSALGAMTAFTIGNRTGIYHTARRVTVRLDRALLVQIDGNVAWESDVCSFKILPNALRIKC
jgi:diacylglycerol kinase (ATP)